MGTASAITTTKKAHERLARPLTERRIAVYDIYTTQGQNAMHSAARKSAWFALWLSWQDNKVPRDLGAVAWAMVNADLRLLRMQALAKEPDANGERPAHDATKRELVMIRRALLSGYLSGLTDGFARFLAHSNYVVPRIVSNRYAGWR